MMSCWGFFGTWPEGLSLRRVRLLRKRSGAYGAVSGVQRITAIAVICSAFLFGTFQGAAEAETRTLKLYNNHTKESVSITFKKNGRYVPSALRDANHFLRDWRRNEATKIDPRLLDLVWEVYQEVGASKPIHVVSSYRSPATNNMLRSRSKGVAKNSQHTLGKAMDFFIPGVNLSKLRQTGMRKQVGGVGYYPKSGSPFVHMDTGNVRHWPKMTRQQLAQVFPDGKTLHVPSDGKPLSGYKLALADAKSGRLAKLNNGRSSRPTIVASNDAPAPRTTGQSLSSGDVVRPSAAPRSQSGGGGSLLASLFTNDDASPQDRPTPPGAIAARTVNATPAASAPSPVLQAPPIPLAKVGDEPTPAPEALPAPEQQPAPEVQDIVVLAKIAPAPKPRNFTAPGIQVASAQPPAPGTLDAQRVALETGAPNPAAPPPSPARFEVAAIVPNQKPQSELITASLNAAVKQKQIAAGIPIPPASPVDDAVSAIAAATSTGPAPTPALRPATTLAYASASATPVALRASLESKAIAHAPQKPVAQRKAQPQQSVSGRIPKDQIQDPLAGFAGLPDKSEPKLLSGEGTMRRALFASLHHPNQRKMKNFFAPTNRFVTGGFSASPYGSLRTDRFDGPAVIVLPVTYTR